MSEIKQCVLIDIDALIDTRVAVIFQKFPSKFKDLDLYKYATRDNNRLWEILDVAEDVWVTAWKERTSVVFESAKPTNLLVHLKTIILSKYVEGKTSPIHEDLTLHINTYPYELSKNDCAEIVESVREWTFDDLNIKVVNLSPKSLKPGFIKATYQSLFMLDWIEWITLHYEELKTVKIPTVTFNIPAFIHDNNPQLMSVVERSTTDPIQQLQRYLAEFMTLVMLKPELFSFITPSPS